MMMIRRQWHTITARNGGDAVLVPFFVFAPFPRSYHSTLLCIFKFHTGPSA
jgi:hypothetical protein